MGWDEICRWGSLSGLPFACPDSNRLGTRPKGCLQIRALRLLIVAAVVCGFVTTGSAHHRVLWGEAVYYSNYYAGRTMACGGTYQPYKMVAAHRTLPCGTRLKVKNRSNGKIVKVTVKDRGPFGDPNRILDLSRRAARKLGYLSAGRARVRAVVLHD